VHTGAWSKKSIEEARKYCSVHVAASSEDRNFTYVPAQDRWHLSPGTAYVHICSNETIGGVEYHWVPDTGDLPLVADMSSHILSRPVEVAKYGLIYAGAQKNMGTAGLTVVIVRDDLPGHALAFTPAFLDYKVQADAGWMFNTPSTYSVYIAGLVFKWLKAEGGLTGMEQNNIAKAKLLYDYLDSSAFFSNAVSKSDRSRMNVTFRLRDEALDGEFLKAARAADIVQIKGHRIVGGMRASIYNAMPLAGVERLVGVMREFEARHA
jgi:phosphoserine aminotransferase